ncbi:MAG: NAD-dependent epimerase/dehydratase family protein [Steroidobacteraceae bacterium]
MNLLVTGAAGFIGSTVAAALLRRGDTRRIRLAFTFDHHFSVAGFRFAT